MCTPTWLPSLPQLLGVERFLSQIALQLLCQAQTSPDAKNLSLEVIRPCGACLPGKFWPIMGIHFPHRPCCAHGGANAGLLYALQEYCTFLDSLEPILATAPPSANWLRQICLRTRLRVQRKQSGSACTLIYCAACLPAFEGNRSRGLTSCMCAHR